MSEMNMYGQSNCLLLGNPLMPKVKLTKPSVVPGLIIRRRSASVALGAGKYGNWAASLNSRAFSVGQSLVSSSAQPIQVLNKSLGIRPSPQLGLLSLLFVLSTAIGAIFSLAIISIPTMNAFRRLADSADKLSKLVSEEVPGTLSSLKLSGLEINELTQQLTNLRQRISANEYRKKARKQ